MSKKILTALVEGVVATAVAVTGTAVVHTEKQEESTTNYCIVQQDVCPKIRNAVDWAKGIADDSSHGYDQIHRWGDPDYDCSSLVISAFRNAGIDTGDASYTGNMYSELTAHGFTAYEFRKEDLQYGDILLTDGHTELYIGDGELVGANSNENYGKGNGKDAFKNGTPGDQTGKEIYTKPYYDDNWYWILRYIPKWYDWYSYPEMSDNFYAFIENGGSFLSSGGGAMHLEDENGNEQQVWHFIKESTGRYTVSNESISGSYNLYKDDAGSIIFNVTGSDTACLTASADVIQTSDYDFCSDAQRFTIRPVSDPIMVEYDFGGSSCPIIEEHYGEPYSGAFDLVITGFSGWYTEREGGVKIDTSKVTIPHSHTLYAHFDATPEEHAMPHGGGGRHDGDERVDEQPTAESKTEVVAIADDIDVQHDDIYHPVRVTEPPVQEVTPATEPVTERTPVRVQSVSVSKTSKMLNTVGGSTGFTLTANVSPSDAEDKRLTFSSTNSSIARVDGNGYVSAVSDGTCYITVTASNGVSASCEVTVKTAYNKTYGAWSAYSETPVSSSSNVEVESYNTTKKEIDRYRCVYYCTKDWDGNRIYDSKSRNGDYSDRNWKYGEWSFAVQLSDPSHDYWDYTPAELSNPVAPGGYLNSNQSGYNGSNETLYTATWGNDVILVAIKDTLYKDVPVTMYRYRSITSSPVEYN